MLRSHKYNTKPSLINSNIRLAVYYQYYNLPVVARDVTIKIMRSVIISFVLRLGVSLVVVGSLYVGISALSSGLRRSHPSPSQRLAGLQASLDQLYISGNQIAQFNESDSITAQRLSRQVTSFKASLAAAKTAFTTAPKTTISANQQELVQQVIDNQQQTITKYQTASAAVSLALSYDPMTDLGLDINKDTSKLIKRAQAAHNGLLKAADSPAPGPSASHNLVAQNSQAIATVIGPSSKQLLQAQADCFDKFGQQLTAKLLAQAAATRSDCLASYPALRNSLVQDLLNASFNAKYADDNKRLIAPLLSQLRNN